MTREWLVADGLGGFASGSTDGIRTRRYHGLLLVASPGDESRYMLVNGLEAWVAIGRHTIPLTSQRYLPNVVTPEGPQLLSAFAAEPWPQWTYRINDELSLVQELVIPRGRAASFLSWRLLGEHPPRLTLHVRPLTSGRDWHALQRENPACAMMPVLATEQHWRWELYRGVPPLVVYADGSYRSDPVWYRNFLYTEERARRLDEVEDLASPGIFSWDMEPGVPANMILTVPEEWTGYRAVGELTPLFRAVRESERARIAAFPSRLHHSAHQYLATRGERHTIIAGFPWFGDWGRDTFVALPGICLATGLISEAESILLSWTDTISEGMLPNYFPAGGDEPEFNSVDASLWFVVAVDAFLREAVRRGHYLKPSTAATLEAACEEVLVAYSRGTRYGIRADDDGLLMAGAPGAAITWMDAIVEGQPVTPRSGKPVEVQALWVNALTIAGRWNARWSTAAETATNAFRERFWNAERNCLFDVVDVDHERGDCDPRVRPNQIFAVGGLPVQLLEGDRARSVVETVERALWTPMGLRTLAPDEGEYTPTLTGPPRERDYAYHQGMAWPWLLTPFVDAWVRTNGNSPAARITARKRFLAGLARHLDVAGVGHISVVADGNAPYTPRGAPFQAWSLTTVISST